MTIFPHLQTRIQVHLNRILLHHYHGLQGEADTIFALATAPGRAGIAVIRLSGLNVPSVLHQAISRPASLLASPRHLMRCSLLDRTEIVDEVMAVYFKAPHSFTGEETAELHLHGSP